MIELGIVNSIEKVSSNCIVSIVLDQGYDGISLNDVSIIFGENGAPLQLTGFKWWIDKLQLDLMFDANFEFPEIGSAAFIIPNEY